MEQLEPAEPYNKLLLGRSPQHEGQVPDSNKHMFGEGLGCAAVPKVVDVSLQIRLSPILSLLLARGSTSERRMTSRAWPSFGRHTRNHLSTVATVNSEILVGRQDDGVGKRFGHANEASIGEAHGNV